MPWRRSPRPTDPAPRPARRTRTPVHRLWTGVRRVSGGERLRCTGTPGRIRSPELSAGTAAGTENTTGHGADTGPSTHAAPQPGAVVGRRVRSRTVRGPRSVASDRGATSRGQGSCAGGLSLVPFHCGLDQSCLSRAPRKLVWTTWGGRRGRVRQAGRGGLELRSPCALAERTRPPPHHPDRCRCGVAPHAGLGVAAALRPLLRRPGPVDPHLGRHPVRLGGPDAAQHRPHLVPGRHGRPPRPARPPSAAGCGLRRGPDRARGRSGVARGGAGPGRVDPGAARGQGARGDRPQHQSADRPHPQPAGAHLPAERLRPGPDDRRRDLPYPGVEQTDMDAAPGSATA